MHNSNNDRTRVKLIFNPKSGSVDQSPMQLMEVLKVLQTLQYIVEVYLVGPQSDLPQMIEDALTRGIAMFVVCGGDGTVSAIAKAMIGKQASLGIIPTGTQNNIALSLGITTDIPDAIGILHNGIRTAIDVGTVTCNDVSTTFIEVCSVGLFSAIFPAGDDILHGDITRIGEFLTSLTTSSPSKIDLLLDDGQNVKTEGHSVLISNMPYTGNHYQFGPLNSFSDGYLDVLFFADLSKLDLIAYILKGPSTNNQEDSRIQHFRVRKMIIDTDPYMPVMVDGKILKEGLIQIEVKPKALNILLSPKVSKAVTEKSEDFER